MNVSRVSRFAAKLVLGAALVAAPAASFASIFLSVNIAPPVLPVYAQPLCPGDGYLWTPGYWAYGDGGYFWVPGTWVRPPQVGFLWTPGYWGWGGGAYLFHAGYWGPHIGFYGGVNYGFGYGGVGYEGGYWQGNRFAYNRTVNNVNITNIHNTYVKNVTVVNNNYRNVSYNGGQGGVPAHARAEELQAEREQHVGPTGEQLQHRELAATNKGQYLSDNGGHPQFAAARTPTAFQQNVQRGGNVVNGRQLNQQQRINQGVNRGQLTPGETRNLENRDQSIHNQAQQDRRANGGALNPQERQQINQRQNNVSQSINQDRRNANNDAAAAQRNGRNPGGEQRQAEQIQHQEQRQTGERPRR